MKELIKLSLTDIDVIRQQTEEDGSIDFALARLKFMATSINEDENSQGYLLDEEVLREFATTALGKFITGKVNPYSKDLMSHMEDNDIFGYIPPNSEITFEKVGNRVFAICDAVISKIYCKDVVDAFRLDNDRCVSIEASVETHPNNPKLIMSFMIHSITILAKFIRGAVNGANMEIIKFSSEQAEDFYNNREENPLKKFAKERKVLNEQHNPNVENEIKLGLDKENNKEENMEDVKLADEAEVTLAENKTEDIIMGSDEETVEMGCGEDAKVADVETIKQSDTEEETKEEEVDDDEKEEQKEAKWSAELVAELVQNSSVKDVVVALFSAETVESLVSNVVALAEEKEELKKEVEKADNEKAKVKFSQIMALAKLKLSDSKYDELYQKGETLKFSELDLFEKDVKACICDMVVFSDAIESNPTVSFGTHMKLTETNSNSLWN